MMVRLVTCLIGLTVAFCTLSCEKMPKWADQQEGETAVVELPQPDSIPLEWGKLVSVTTREQDYRCVLWFQDEAANIRAVGYDFQANQLLSHARLFTRR